MPERNREPPTQPEKLLRSDGALCLTLVNTGSAERQSLDSYDDLLAWGVETGALADADSRRLAAIAAEHPGNAADVVRRAQTLSARLERIFLALAVGKAPAGTDFGPFNAELRQAMATRELVAAAGGYRWSWGDGDGDDLDRMLWPVLYSAATLLISRHRGRVRRCQQQGCGLLFVARGGGRPRKFCGLACRNRSTSQTHYERYLKPRRVRWRQEQQRVDRERGTEHISSRKSSEAEED